MRERPPRFQTSQRKESNEDRSKNYDDSRKQTLSTRQSNYENKSRKRSADRQRKVGYTFPYYKIIYPVVSRLNLTLY